MDTRHLVDPDLAPMLDMALPVDITPEGLPATRMAIADMFAVTEQDDGLDVSVEELSVPGPGGSIRVMAVSARDAPRPMPAILHIHGGGYMLGTPEMNLPANRALAAALGCAVFSVDYRLAPENPYPAGLDDCYAVLGWIVENASRLGIDPGRIAVKGESAGGGLAAGVALLVRERGGPPLAFQCLVYPMIDDRSFGSDHPFVGQYQWTREENRTGWRCLLGKEPGGQDVSPFAAPARAEDLAGLPPTFLMVGALDLFLDEDLDFARRLSRAGVPVELHVYPGAFHGFDIMSAARVTKAATRDCTEALRRAFHG